MRTALRISLFAALVLGCTTASPAPDAYAPDGGIDAWHELLDAPAIFPDTNDPDAAIVVDVGTDANVDATFGRDVGPTCMPEGSYPLDWVGASTNPSDCLSPSEGVTVGPDGLDTGETTPCSGSGCDASDCQQQPATADSCASSIHFDAPCHGLAVSQSFDGTLVFGPGGHVDATATTHRADGSSCAFTASGTRS